MFLILSVIEVVHRVARDGAVVDEFYHNPPLFLWIPVLSTWSVFIIAWGEGIVKGVLMP
jgi:hypothetical protein